MKSKLFSITNTIRRWFHVQSLLLYYYIRACSFLKKTTHKRSHPRLGYGIYPELKQLNEKPCYCVWLNCMHVVTLWFETVLYCAAVGCNLRKTMTWNMRQIKYIGHWYLMCAYNQRCYQDVVARINTEH
jgi:hypothetical protein